MQSRVARPLLILVLLLIAGAVVFLVMSRERGNALPPGVVSGNGRLEATEVDVATKVAGRLAKVLLREGDDVAAGQVVAELDAEDLQAQLRAGEAQVRQAQAAIVESRAALASAESQQRLAKLTFDRTSQLVQRNFVSSKQLDQDRSGLQTAEAATAAARSRVREAGEAQAAAEAKVDALRVTVNDATLKAPASGRVLYRLAEPGEVLAAGGKALTLLDMSDVYMSIYLSADEAGKVALGGAARIVLDAVSNQVVPARVVFVAPRSQFTPKEVETRNEREKLMFRVKVKVEPEWLASHGDLAKPGMPGVAYVQTAADAVWPPDLIPR